MRIVRIPEDAAPAMCQVIGHPIKGSTQCPRMQVRAALLAQLLRLVNGSSAVRLQVVEALLDALNSNSLSLQGHITDIDVQQQIADAMAGMYCHDATCGKEIERHHLVAESSS